jgi:hypothetical protein
MGLCRLGKFESAADIHHNSFPGDRLKQLLGRLRLSGA